MLMCVQAYVRVYVFACVRYYCISISDLHLHVFIAEDISEDMLLDTKEPKENTADCRQVRLLLEQMLQQQQQQQQQEKEWQLQQQLQWQQQQLQQ